MAGPPQARLGDKSMVPADSHGCPACPHPCIGPAVGGSPDVFVNGLPAVRVGDPGIHAACCGPNTWKAKAGSATVLINGKKAHRQGDADKHCGGTGQMVEGSPNVFTGGGGGGGIGVTFSTPVGDISLSADASGNIDGSLTTQTVAGTSVTVGAEGNVVDGTASASAEVEGDVVSASVEASSDGTVKGSVEVSKGDDSVKLSADNKGNVGVEASYKKAKAGVTHNTETGKTEASASLKMKDGTEFKAGGDSDGGFNASVANGANKAEVSGAGGEWQANATAAGPNGSVTATADSDQNWGVAAATPDGMGGSINGDGDGNVAVSADSGKEVKDFVGDVPLIGGVNVAGGVQIAGDKGPHGNDISIPVGPGIIHLNDDGQLSGGAGIGGVSGVGSVNLGDDD